MGHKIKHTLSLALLTKQTLQIFKYYHPHPQHSFITKPTKPSFFNTTFQKIAPSPTIHHPQPLIMQNHCPTMTKQVRAKQNLTFLCLLFITLISNSIRSKRLSKLGIICIARLHMGGSTHGFKNQTGPVGSTGKIVTRPQYRFGNTLKTVAI